MHLDSNQIAAYLTEELTTEQLEQVEDHLSRCPECRDEIAVVAEVVGGAKRKSRRPVAGIAVAAAAIVAAILLIQSPTDISTSGPVMRDGSESAEEPVQMAVVFPENGADVVLDSLKFVWRGAEAMATYRFTLTQANGDVLWTQSTPDTVLTLTSEVGVRSGQTYFWYVDALLPEGRTSTTGTYLFRTRP